MVERKPARGFSTDADTCGLKIERGGDDLLVVRFSGEWLIKHRLPAATQVTEALEASPTVKRVRFYTAELKQWDTGFLTFLKRIMGRCADMGVAAEHEELPDGVKRLLMLASAVPEKQGARRSVQHIGLMQQVGQETLKLYRSALDMLDFIGQSCLSLLRMATGRARFRKRDLWLTIQECGANALPIVSLISFLVGLILAFVGAIQLQRFGAQIYVADLVGIAMAREMGCMMTAIVMAGRTGAAFAAQLGTMTVNEEIDAFKTLGFSPMDFLVLPRMVALAIMMPLLTLYSNLLGVVGGIIVAVTLLDISFSQYVNQTITALKFGDVGVGLTKAVIFGMLVALAGCLRGMQCGRSSAAVGLAATSAVVSSIVLIIVTDAIFAVVTNILGI